MRVVDFSQYRTGAQATQVLADFGADVWWVEPPGGSPLREAAAFPFYGRGKQSIVIDLKDPAGAARAADLAAAADVVVETSRPGVMDRLGLGYERLCARNPRLVFASITGFGQDGPYAGIKAYEGIVQAKVGAFKAFERMAHTSHPPFVAVPWCSFAATQAVLHGILAALVEREGSGQGQRVDTTMVQGFAALDTWDWFLDLVTQRYPDAFTPSDAYAKGTPLSPVVYMLLVGLTKDGHWLQFAAVAPRLFLALMNALGLSWMFTDPEWKGIPLFEDDERRTALLDRMQAAVGEKTLAEWQALFETDDNLYAEVCRAGPAVLDHPQLRATGAVVSVSDPLRGPVRQPGPITDLIGDPADVGRPAPRIDEHGLLPVVTPVSGAAAGTGLPLDGVTVLEMAVQFAAPYAATVLTDLGARVIKVEQLGGDPIRTMMPFPESGGAKVMQGKESVCVDIGSPEGAEIVRQLAARADLVLDGYRPGATDRHGVGAESLQAVNDRLVHVSASGYGPGGPCSNRPAFAPSIGAASGIARANVGATVEEVPGLSPGEVRDGSIRLFSGAAVVKAQADGFAALGVATSMLLGLLARERTGKGQRVSTSMLVTATHAMAEEVVDFEGRPPSAGSGPDLRGPAALYRIYDASDGWVFLAAPQPEEWDRLVAAMRPYADLAPLVDQEDALVAGLAEVFVTRGKDEWERELLAADVACVAVCTERSERFLQSEVGRACGYAVPTSHPTFDEHLRLAPLVRFSRSATQAKGGVLAGNATDAVLAELGYSSEAVADLRARSIVA
jgi:crotonobetainyl-CoA:carnitine CoA-transferase CaiB-like acyl-CoA transferase